MMKSTQDFPAEIDTEIVEEAKEKVAAWDARVAAWREKHGTRRIPEGAFIDHPAMNFLMTSLILRELLAGAELGDPETGSLFASVEAARTLCAKVLSIPTTGDLRKGAPHFRRKSWGFDPDDFTSAALNACAATLCEMAADAREADDDNPLTMVFKTADVVASNA